MNEDKNTQRKDSNHNFIYENDILEIYSTYKNLSSCHLFKRSKR
ncbi:hypothetical protein [Campylobacter upsaliensis]|nr:hypothetical protein [Campylobacter upsaliensis]MEB2799651.1 hypothetical protein [Campylobacter upsaliensis]MEB2835525.1 hypothetical protein [Campylobacter upsaliensis]